MVISFLDLPREIRDLIYAFALTSPTSHLLITLHKTARPTGRSSSSTTGIRLRPCLQSSSTPLYASSPPSTALQRTSRQIRTETVDWVWKHNIIVFAAPSDVIDVFKHMGQRPSRLLQRVCVCINEAWGPDKSTLGRALSMLASRTRRGELVSVRLLFEVLDIGVRHGVLNGFSAGEEMAWPFYKNLLLGLRKGERAGWETRPGRVERELVFGCEVRDRVTSWPEDICRERIEAAAQELHCAWGGRLVCNGCVVWDNYVKVGDVPMPDAPRRETIFP